MHMLAYFMEPGPGPLQDRLAELQQGRGARNGLIVEALNGLDIDITIEEVEAESGGGSIGRPHIAAILVRKGAAHSMAEAFDRYLADGRPAYRPRLRLEAAEAAALTRASGGVAVVAHPHTVAGAHGGLRRGIRVVQGDRGLAASSATTPSTHPTSARRLAVDRRRLRADRHRGVRLPRHLQAGPRTGHRARRPGGARRRLRGAAGGAAALKGRRQSADTSLDMSDTARPVRRFS